MNAAPIPNPANQADYYTDLPVGEILRRTRAHYDQTLDDVANYLRIRASQLEAIEKGDLAQLPGRVYVIGYIRTYAEYLGLDGEKMVTLFKQQAGGKTQKPELHFPVPASESKAPNLYIIFGSLAVLALVIGVWMALSAAGNKSRDKNITEIPSVPPEMRVVRNQPVPAQSPSVVQQPAPALAAATPDLNAGSIPASTTVVMPQPNAASDQSSGIPVAIPSSATAAINPSSGTPAAQTGAPIAAKKEIVMTIRDRSWVEVRDKAGKPILSRILKPGEVFVVPEANYGLRLDTGNAGGIDLTVNGEPYPALGKQGDILRGFVLDGNKMAEKKHFRN